MLRMTMTAALASSILISGCNGKPAPQAVTPASKNTAMTIEQVQAKYEDQLMSLPGVVGIAIGMRDTTIVLKVLVISRTRELEKEIPRTLEGYQVVIEETGEIRAQERR